jgi:hypothetical protein
MRRALNAALGVCAAAIAVTGCGSTPQPAAKTVTVVQPAATPPPPAAEAAAPAPPPPPPPPPAASKKITVPNVVGKNHQDAQDTMQSVGLYALAEEDATGQGRMLIIDRNWHVVRQSPAAGSRVSENTTITLSSKKYSDP